MPKPLALSIALCLGLAGCQVVRRSDAWAQATRVRPGETARDPDSSSAYAAKLHQALAERGLEHKVVTYQFHYTTRRYEEAIGTRTAVIYRDAATPSHPWWLKDDRLIHPFWLPNGSLDQQISFYLRRPAEVIEQQDYPARSVGGKATVASARPSSPARPAPLAARPSPITKIAVMKAAPAPSEQRAATPKAGPPSAPEQVKQAPEAITRLVAARPTPVQKPPIETPRRAPEPLPQIAAAPWSPPTILDSTAQAKDPAPRDPQLEEIFQARHGTSYNPASPIDRRKMEQLSRGPAGRE